MIGLAASVSPAQQIQQFGRDSLYAVPGHSETSHPTPPVAVDAPSLQPFGRDSVYATQLKVPTAPVASDATSLQPYGRDSVYAIQLDKPGIQDSGTAVSAAGDKAHGG